MLVELYGSDGAATAARLDALVAAQPRPARSGARWSETDAWMIAYPDQFGATGIDGIGEVVQALEPEITGAHVLPFHPSSSDGGFAVMDHGQVDPAVGDWDDLDRLAGRTRVMADAVVNHVSARGTWFRGHLAADPEFRDYFRSVAPDADLSAVARPRPGRPTTTFTRADGTEVDYWTTFGADQVDLDYRSPEVLLAVFEAIFRYVRHGASVIRLDAVAFLGKDPSTASMHRPETHAIVALLRSCLDEIDPAVVLVTETNVPHADNVAYLGSDEAPEAHAVYQFPLAPLVLHAVQQADAGPLRRWAAGCTASPGTTVLNFLASHDGVGLRPAAGWLRRDEIDELARRGREAGGLVNEASTATGSEPYELAATWRSLCGVGVAPPRSDSEAAACHLATHSVMLALRGIPLLYVHSLVGSENDRDRQAASGVARDLNRGRFVSPAAFVAATGDGFGGAVWRGLQEMLAWRGATSAHHPESPQRIVESPGPSLVVERGSGAERDLVATNLGRQPVMVEIGEDWTDRSTGQPAPSTIRLGAWDRRWFAARR